MKSAGKPSPLTAGRTLGIDRAKSALEFVQRLLEIKPSVGKSNDCALIAQWGC